VERDGSGSVRPRDFRLALAASSQAGGTSYRSSSPPVVALGGISAEHREQAQHVPIDGELDDRPAVAILADDVTGLQDSSQQLARLTHRPPRWLDVAGRTRRARRGQSGENGLPECDKCS
jgi:hypothetical protein